MKPLRILSLGAGVQSSTLLLMACRGELQIDHAIFADTQWEPKAVYDWLEFLKVEAGKAGIPLHVVTAGSLRDGCLKKRRGGLSHARHVSMPYHVQGDNGNGGMVRRQCTQDYKIQPIEKHLRSLLNLKPWQRWPKEHCITQCMGISRDEAHRMRTSQRSCIVFEYPLIDRRMTRLDCLQWLEARGYARSPRSSCIGCPFHSNSEWNNLTPAELSDAASFERELQASDASKGMRHALWLHRSRKPLDTVDLSPSDQTDMFGNECMGLCGT